MLSFLRGNAPSQKQNTPSSQGRNTPPGKKNLSPMKTSSSRRGSPVSGKISCTRLEAGTFLDGYVKSQHPECLTHLVKNVIHLSKSGCEFYIPIEVMERPQDAIVCIMKTTGGRLFCFQIHY